MTIFISDRQRSNLIAPLRCNVVTMKFIKFLLFTCVLGSCGSDKYRPGTTSATENVAGGKQAGNVTATATAAPVALNAYRETLDLTGYDDLGSYHFRRLHFYSKEKPGIKIGPSEVEHITLYFIDRYLVKIRYKLSEDVSGFLADSLATEAGKKADMAKNWALNHQIRWNYFSKTITYVNRCPESDLASELTKEVCDSGYWLYAELPGYNKKVKELESVAKYMVEYLIDDPPNKAEEE